MRMTGTFAKMEAEWVRLFHIQHPTDNERVTCNRIGAALRYINRRRSRPLPGGRRMIRHLHSNREAWEKARFVAKVVRINNHWWIDPSLHFNAIRRGAKRLNVSLFDLDKDAQPSLFSYVYYYKPYYYIGDVFTPS